MWLYHYVCVHVWVSDVHLSVRVHGVVHLCVMGVYIGPSVGGSETRGVKLADSQCQMAADRVAAVGNG